jgi:hypothetical protein
MRGVEVRQEVVVIVVSVMRFMVVVGVLNAVVTLVSEVVIVKGDIEAATFTMLMKNLLLMTLTDSTKDVDLHFIPVINCHGEWQIEKGVLGKFHQPPRREKSAPQDLDDIVLPIAINSL